MISPESDCMISRHLMLERMEQLGGNIEENDKNNRRKKSYLY